MVKKKELIERWNPDLNLSSMIKSSKGFDNIESDFRGIPYGNLTSRKNLDDFQISDSDFTYSSFENCNFTNAKFLNCNFENANFIDTRFWDCEFIGCKFHKTDFRNATLGVNSIFDDCKFTSSKLKGKYFNFGYYSKFLNSKFSSCEIQSAWILSASFRNCHFDSKFTNVRFSGKKEAEVSSRKEFPATFIDCNMEHSTFIRLEIMDGAILENTKLPNQKNSRFNNDRIYYE